ncbi:putative Leucine-rich repeat-containing protein 15-like 2 [Homarus americanus]|uniref:Putative Leucine-rich repeat-containing protein 15-like 2 n=1 Tax=Homarus americanus TaxID=6706 RepID=A0A8J5JXF5_HOMAM|nr:putative Leucine-rich repeat-containing protein 15-like 2 [Homarus americanus]
MFGPLLYNISLYFGYIDFWFNRIACDCDILWFLSEPSLDDHLIYGRCKNGTFISNIDVDELEAECQVDHQDYPDEFYPSLG